MSTPAVPLRPFSSGRDPATQSGGDFVVGGPGAEDFVALVPLVEVESAGSPPVVPALVVNVSPAWEAGTVRRVMGGSGAAVTSSLASAGRARFRVQWGARTQAERDMLVAWLLDEVVIGGPGGALRSMSIAVDGAGVDPVELRITDAGGEVERLLDCVRGRSGLYTVGPFECEEVL